MTNATVSIYALLDPREPDVVRYVGMSEDTHNRFLAHLREAKKKDTHKDRWIRKLKADGITPVMKIIEECPKSEWEEREIFWIAKMRSDGHPLVNSTRGGDGVVDCESARLKMRGNRNGAGHHYKPTPEVIEKLREASKGKGIGNKWGLGKNLGNQHARGYQYTEEQKKRRSQNLLGNKRTLGRVMPQHEKDQRSDALKGRPKSEETRKRIAAANQARGTSARLMGIVGKLLMHSALAVVDDERNDE